MTSYCETKGNEVVVADVVVVVANVDVVVVVVDCHWPAEQYPPIVTCSSSANKNIIDVSA